MHSFGNTFSISSQFTDCPTDCVGERDEEQQKAVILSDDGKHYILNGTKQFITNGGLTLL